MGIAESMSHDNGGACDDCAYRLFPIANRVNFREDAGDRWSASLAPEVALLPGLPVLRLSSLRRAPRLATGFRAEGVRQVKKLYIGNLPFSATEEQLQEWFSQIGVTPSGVNLIRDRFTEKSRGFAFVEVKMTRMRTGR